MIAELLEKEKATGKRIQDLCARAEACETEREGLQRKMDQQAADLAELERKAAETPDIVTLRRERDILLGRVERFKEEQILEARRRDRRFAELARTFPGISPRITAAPIGPAIRVFVPDEILFRKIGRAHV